MPKVRVSSFSISLDGYGAGPEQSAENPLGQGGESLHEWIFPTRTFRKMYGKGEGTTGWRGWWGEEPPYHCPVFVLTHHPRPPLEMKGGTVFHFVTDGIEDAIPHEKSNRAA